jgi:DNA polymerase-1
MRAFGPIVDGSTRTLPNVSDPRLKAWLLDADGTEVGESFAFVDLCQAFACTLHSDIDDESSPTSAVATLLSDLHDCVAFNQAVDVHMQAVPRLLDCYVHQELGVAIMLAQLEVCGVGFDRDLLENQVQQMHARLMDIDRQAQHAAGEPFLVTSPEQVAHILFEKLGLPVIQTAASKRKKTTVPSTSEQVLQKIVDTHPTSIVSPSNDQERLIFARNRVPALVLQYRHVHKLVSTFVEPFIEASRVQSVLGRQQRISCNWNQTNTGTGRLSSSGPNLQTLPKAKEASLAEAAFVSSDDTEEPNTTDADRVSIRAAFCARAGCTLLSADFSCMEMRLCAYFAQDPALLSVFACNDDVYQRMASVVFQKRAVSEVERNQAKTVTLGLLYGMQPAALAARLTTISGAHVSYEQASALQSRHFMQRSIKECRENNG